MRAQRRFPAVSVSVPAARQFVLSCLPPGDVAAHDQVALMVSELVTNAIVHGLTTFDVTVDLTDNCFRVEVTDTGAGIPAMQLLTPTTNEHGRGLRIVEEIADRWGVDAVEGDAGKRVWFELALSSRRARV